MQISETETNYIDHPKSHEFSFDIGISNQNLHQQPGQNTRVQQPQNGANLEQNKLTSSFDAQFMTSRQNLGDDSQIKKEVLVMNQNLPQHSQSQMQHY